MKVRQTLACVLGVALMAGLVNAEEKGTAKKSPVLDNKMKTLTGKTVDLEDKYKGKVLLIVNVASKCGATPQYEQLEALHEKYNDKGLAIVGVPCNQFGKQEPGSDEEIGEFCQKNYGVKFDMLSKVDVNGEKAAPLFKYLTSEKAGLKDFGPVKWNFEKFLIAKDGSVAARFRTGVKPDAPEVVSAIEAELAKK